MIKKINNALNAETYGQLLVNRPKTLPAYKAGRSALRQYQFLRKKEVQRMVWMECTSTVNTSPLHRKALGAAVVLKTETEISAFDKIFIL